MKLSIAIPTFNRAEFLRQNLIELQRQILLLDQPVEVVISDNASTDNSENIVQEFLNEKISFRYLRNSTNLGMDINVDLAIRACRGEYVLLLGDDDLLESNAIEKILNCLHKYPDLGMIYMNFRVYDRNLENEINFRDLAFDPVEKDSYFPDGIYVMEKTNKIFAALSGGVYLRELWLNAQPKRFWGTIFIHVGVTLDILCRVRAPAYIFKTPLFKYRLNDSSPGKIKPYDEIFQVSFGLLKIIVVHKKYLSAITYRVMYNKELSWARKNIFGAKARESVKIIKTLLKMRLNYDTSRLSFWIIDVPILFIPKWILYAPYQLYRFLKYHKIEKIYKVK
jgi:glycosyltransferase involved in cell wall biosynthesis